MGVFSFLVLCHSKRFVPRQVLFLQPEKQQKDKWTRERPYPLSTALPAIPKAHPRHHPHATSVWPVPQPFTLSWAHMCFAVIILTNPPNNLVWEVLLSHFLDVENWLELNVWFKSHRGNMVMTLGEKISGPLLPLRPYRKKPFWYR